MALKNSGIFALPSIKTHFAHFSFAACGSRSSISFFCVRALDIVVANIYQVHIHPLYLALAHSSSHSMAYHDIKQIALFIHFDSHFLVVRFSISDVHIIPMIIMVNGQCVVWLLFSTCPFNPFSKEKNEQYLFADASSCSCALIIKVNKQIWQIECFQRRLKNLY